MSDNNEKTVHGIVAEYTSVDTLLDACRRVRDAGYTKIDAFTPFAVHGIDKALGIKPTVLPWIVLACGLTGMITGLSMQLWMNAYNYPYIISGKPFALSLPAFMPVVFELTVLFSSFGAFFGMWALNGLPRYSNPMFTDPRFDRVTDDKFFLFIDSKDDRFDADGIKNLLGDTATDYIHPVLDDDSSAKVPKPFFIVWGLVAALSVVPLLIVLKMRVTKSSSPRFHVFYDMDFSPSKDAQQGSTLFADGRAMRPDVPGTVIRGDFGQDMNFLTGVDVEELAATDADRADRLVRRYLGPLQEDAEDSGSGDGGSGDGGAAPPSVMDTTPWLEENPLEMSSDLLQRGRKYFDIYCSVCHGRSGGGNGLVNRRAQKILAATWIPPSALNQPTLYQDKYPDGKLFSTISNGIRKMPGYASQIKARDRWAIVAYVRALQQSQDASIDLVPDDQRDEILKQKAEVDEALAKQAEAERKAEQERAKQEGEQGE